MVKNPLAWLKGEVEAGRFDLGIALLVIVATPALVIWILIEVFRLIFR